MKPIKLTNHQWFELRLRLREDYPNSVMLIRKTMKEKLGFTPRTHQTWDNQKGTEYSVFLDFFDEPKRIFFVLKYSEYFDASEH